MNKSRQGSNKIPSTLIGSAGEHLVLSRLLRRGMRAGLSPAGTPEVDILVVDEIANVQVGLQVKTRTRGTDGGWHLQKRHEEIRSRRIVYVLVDFQPEHPSCYVIPSTVVADVVRKSHAAWLATPGKGGRRHSQTDMRRILPRYPFRVPGVKDGWLDEYREKWDLLTTH